MVDWNNKRPEMVDNVSALGIGKAIYAAPDGNKETARLLVAADGFHFKNSDFDDLKLLSISLFSPTGSAFSISFDDDGSLLVNGVKYKVPTNQEDETIKGNKTYEGKTNLKGGLQLLSPNGTVFNVLVDDDGKLTTEKEVSDGSD
ncbi:hypothetical protein CRI85_02650 [Leuconostoc pseudomesenteroides]|uniref:hypothetical protein n=1 Tax=Leuconostoc pseudomesenteroides TaxID=33968 RepID=UPI001E628EB0|nr:hypothetical protein [Leuconostoc pseudomesenteroides]MCC8439247.1 hypothetical protein [Leuconostoc pseudomesenteroides]